MNPMNYSGPNQSDGQTMTDQIRTTCYSHRVKAAAEALGMDPLSSADDVLKAIINKTQRSTVEDAKRLVLAALAKYEHA